jgi:hypothetical protein
VLSVPSAKGAISRPPSRSKTIRLWSGDQAGNESAFVLSVSLVSARHRIDQVELVGAFAVEPGARSL